LNKINNYLNLNSFIAIIIIISFFLGFYLEENSSGGAVDFIHVLNNLNTFHNNSFFKINWMDYESSALPLYYVVTSLFYNPENLIPMRVFCMFLSILSFILFFLILKMNLKIDKSLVFLIASLIFLSPYFRTSSYWMMEENFAILMILISFYFYFRLSYKFNYFILFLVIFFSACAFFSRQNYIVINFILFLLIFDGKKLFSKKNFWILIFYLISFCPIIYFIIAWKGLIPPLLVSEKRAFIFYFYNIPHLMNIILIYSVPFIYLRKESIINFLNKNKFQLIFFLLIYLIIFNKFYPNILGGGAINKLLFMFTDGLILKYLTIISSYLSFVILYFLFKENKIIMTFFSLNILLFCTINPVWQEYFDPITLMFILMFSKLLTNINLQRFVYILASYLIMFLSSSLIDQNLIFINYN
jgi:hypothetical protein